MPRPPLGRTLPHLSLVIAALLAAPSCGRSDSPTTSTPPPRAASGPTPTTTAATAEVPTQATPIYTADTGEARVEADLDTPPLAGPSVHPEAQADVPDPAMTGAPEESAENDMTADTDMADAMSAEPTTTQPADADQETAPDATPVTNPADANRAPLELAARNLGHRAAAVRLRQRVIPTVVLVSDGGSFAEVIASWRPDLRFPVLWDDGTVEAAEHIARFVRAFKPEAVVRHQTDTPWPVLGRDREQRLQEVRTQALGLVASPNMDHDAALLAWMRSVDYAPVGVVVTDADDTAWPAALALAAGRFQPFTFLPVGRSNPSAGMSSERAGTMDTTIRAALDNANIAHLGLGDLDAITLVGDYPVRVNAGEDDFRSLTDRLGRLRSDAEPTGEIFDDSNRWAWAGQIFGSEARATYTAMCSLFLETDSLWGFNGYDNVLINNYSIEAAAEFLNQNMGFTSTVFDRLQNPTSTWWSAITDGGIDAGMVLVNSHGNAPEFNLHDGRLYAGDLPLLQRPAFVQFIHSFSMQRPSQTNSVGGRFLAHGAYAYVGSMHEPYLDAFVGAPTLALRLAEGWPLGAAARNEHRGWWRITIHGDPLITLASAGTRVDQPLPLQGTTDLTNTLTPALQREDFATALRALVLLGRDDDAARLVRGLLDDRVAALGPGIARLGLGPLFRAGFNKDVLRLWSFTGQGAIESPILADTLWHAGQAELPRNPDAFAVLQGNLRPDQPGGDATLLARHLSRTQGRPAARAFLDRVREQVRGNRRELRIIGLAERELGI